MIIFLLNTFFCTIKLLVISWFTNDQVFFKLVISLLLIVIIWVLYKFPKPLENALDVVESYYKIHNKTEKVISFIMLFLYIVIFIGGILSLRYMNNTKTLDLSLIYNKIYNMFLYHSIISIIINITLIIIVIIAYVLLLKKIIKFFKKYFIKLHIYYSRHDNWYNTYIFEKFSYSYDYKSLINKISTIQYPILNKDLFTFDIRYHLIVFVKSIHYIILIFVLLYDII